MNRDRLGDNAIKINTRDRLLRAWENSMEMVLDFQDYYQEIKDNEKVSKIFAEFAEDEAMHATRFRELLHEYQNDYLKQ